MSRFLLALLAAFISQTAAAQAQFLPSRPVTWMVPYPAGGGADVVSRMIAPEIAKNIGQSIVIENRPGASTQVGMRAVMESNPDGHSIGLMTADLNVTSALSAKAPFDTEKDFAYLTTIVSVPMFIVSNAKAPFSDLKEFIAYVKANPGKVTAASIGVTSIHHVGLEWFKKIAGLDFLVVPYRGTAPAAQALIAGEVQLMFIGIGVVDDHISNGTLRRIAVGSAKRLQRAPDMPTLMEEGYPTFDLVSWYGMFGPPKMPRPAVDFWNKQIRAVVERPDIKKKIEDTGAIVTTGTPEETAAFVAKETRKFEDVAKLTGLKGQAQ